MSSSGGAYGHDLGKRHIRESLAIIDRLLSAMPSRVSRLGDLKRADIKARLVRLSESGLSAGTINRHSPPSRRRLDGPFETISSPKIRAKVSRDSPPQQRRKVSLTMLSSPPFFGLAWVGCPRPRPPYGLRRRQVRGSARLWRFKPGYRRGSPLHSPFMERRRQVKESKERRRAGSASPRRGPGRAPALLETNPHGTSAETFPFYGAEAARPLDRASP